MTSAATRVSDVVRNHYCAGEGCRRTTLRLVVRMRNRTYYYCVRCGRRLELRRDVRKAG